MPEGLQEVAAGKLHKASERLLTFHHGFVGTVFEFCLQLRKNTKDLNFFLQCADTNVEEDEPCKRQTEARARRHSQRPPRPCALDLLLAVTVRCRYARL